MEDNSLRDQMFTKMQVGTKEMQQAKTNSIILIGKTSGKTTLAYYLTGKPLESTNFVGSVIFKLPEGTQMRQAAINTEGDS
jgi:polynucleotide 5'-kinase involved in rRNA processing